MTRPGETIGQDAFGPFEDILASGRSQEASDALSVEAAHVAQKMSEERASHIPLPTPEQEEVATRINLEETHARIQRLYGSIFRDQGSVMQSFPSLDELTAAIPDALTDQLKKDPEVLQVFYDNALLAPPGGFKQFYLRTAQAWPRLVSSAIKLDASQAESLEEHTDASPHWQVCFRSEDYFQYEIGSGRSQYVTLDIALEDAIETHDAKGLAPLSASHMLADLLRHAAGPERKIDDWCDLGYAVLDASDFGRGKPLSAFAWNGADTIGYYPGFDPFDEASSITEGLVVDFAYPGKVQL